MLIKQSIPIEAPLKQNNMPSIKDDRGYNQGFKPCDALNIRTERRCKYIMSKMNLAQKAIILEIGCGTGKLSFLLAKNTGWDVLGIDRCQAFIEEARQNFNLKNLHYDIIDINQIETLRKQNTFDYIVGDGILHHLYYNMDSALKDFNSLLKENGKIIFLEPNILNPYCYLIFNFALFRKLANLEPGEMAFTKRFITEKLKRFGFSNIQIEYKDFLLPNTPSHIISPVIIIGSLLENIPIINKLSQSMCISAVKDKTIS